MHEFIVNMKDNIVLNRKIAMERDCFSKKKLIYWQQVARNEQVSQTDSFQALVLSRTYLRDKSLVSSN